MRYGYRARVREMETGSSRENAEQQEEFYEATLL